MLLEQLTACVCKQAARKLSKRKLKALVKSHDNSRQAQSLPSNLRAAKMLLLAWRLAKLLK